MVTLAQQLRKAIKDSGMTANGLSKESGVSQPVISRFLNRERDLTLETAGKIAKTLNLELKPKESKDGKETKTT